MTRSEISRKNTEDFLESYESKELNLAYKEVYDAVAKGSYDVMFYDPKLSKTDMECLKSQGYAVSAMYDDEDDPESDNEIYTISWR
jgi:hypothetical protein